MKRNNSAFNLNLLSETCTRTSREEVAAKLSVSPELVRAMLRKASKAIPLVADPEPLDIIHEA